MDASSAQQTEKSGASFLSGNTGPLHDNYARHWFITLAEAMERRVKSHIEAHGEPEDYHIFHTNNKGNLGIEVSLHVHKANHGLVYRFYLSANKYEYERWAREHLYLMEDLCTFRIGPAIWAHPGRDPKPIRIAGKDRKKPIQIWEMEHGFLGKGGVTQFFNLFRETIRVEVTRNDFAGPDDSDWLVNRTR